MTIDFYMHPVSPPCRAVIMAAQHLDIKLNDIFIDIVTGDSKKPELLKINPIGAVPTINDDGFYLWESRSIMAYFVNMYSPGNPVYPEDPKLRAVVDRMLYFDATTLYKSVLEILIPVALKGIPLDDIESDKFENLKKALTLFEGFLNQTKYAVGNHMTIADFALAASITTTEFIDFDLSEYSKINEWMQRLKKEIPSFEEINDITIKKFKEAGKSKEK